MMASETHDKHPSLVTISSTLDKNEKSDTSEKVNSEKFVAFYKDKFIGIYRKTNEIEIIGRPEFVLQDIK